MGKLIIPPEKAAGKTDNATAAAAASPTTASHTAINCGQSSKTVHSGNILFCVVLIVSLILSAYAFLRQTHYENRIRHLDNRISQLEEKLRLFPLAFLNSMASTTTMPTYEFGGHGQRRRSISESESESTVPKIDIISDAAVAAAATVDGGAGDNIMEMKHDDATAIQQSAQLLQKLSLQVSDVQRLRRDVSHLKASRRGERQASVHPTDCSCPPGK